MVRKIKFLGTHLHLDTNIKTKIKKRRGIFIKPAVKMLLDNHGYVLGWICT